MARTVVVTGGTAGIGLACAEKFAAEGWNVGIVARAPARLRETENLLRAKGVLALGIETDVADHAAVERAAERFERELGPIEVWVNNAMATVVAAAHRIEPDEYKRVTDVTYHGQVFGTLAALKRMRTRGRGAIVQINSVLGIRPFPLQAAYAGAKGAALNFTNALRSELYHEGLPVTLTSVFLPAVNTPQFSGWARNRTGRRQIAPNPVYDPRLCAEAVHFAVEHPRRDIWVGRTSVLASVLQRVWPNAGDVQAKSGWDAQLSDERFAENEGNLFKPGEGPARLHGPFGDRMSSARRAFWTSRQRDVAVLGGVAFLAAHLAFLAGRRLGDR
ncbi:SDR family oxidoreductase [Aureimonas leprariae]|uniref:SDR family NAD(P)-dependent oxidoreductase n=1 Tax=Plantimonas leprariae TaxID=2615207 RepID=A0A7V7PNZ9_9HYPH|nr:SDR family oxidoreductase [Aureimonas leprariae]KAB0679610.1 SDR family NAD(P)-dependent oxidoreductase [Aureimonas leprariae]